MFGRRRSADDPPAGGVPTAEVVGELTSVVIRELTVPGTGVHIDTALAGVSATAGTMLLRRLAGTTLDTLEPGSSIFFDRVNDEGPAVLANAQAAAHAAGITWDTVGGDVPPDNQPHGSHVDLVRQLEAPISRVLVERGVDVVRWPDAVMLACVDLLVRAGTLIDPAIGTRIITWGLVVGSKTVPYPSPDEPRS